MKNKGIPVGKRDLTERVFVHRDGGRFEGTAYDFRHQFGVGASMVSVLINEVKSRKSAKGWRYVGEKKAA